ncbi:MAG: carboxypeptidase regulatory-like domain-containing protein [Lewinellaceae bacterium]|nr:carboxypeptidase regulatory-like domain-containing protein [Lewinellaceae bacterium]
MADSKTPVILLAFANDDGRSLRHLDEEQRILKQKLRQAEGEGKCLVQVLPAAKAADVIQAFQEYRGRIKVFHYGGHSDDDEIFFKSSYEQANSVQAQNLAEFLALQPGLELLFLNSCLSLPQAKAYHQAGVKAVIATDRAIGDQAACNFAALFYSALASGADIIHAFQEAETGFRVQFEENLRGLMPQYEDTVDQLPWQVYPQLPHSWSLSPAARTTENPGHPWWRYVTAAAVIIGILGGLAEVLNFINPFPVAIVTPDSDTVTVLAHGPAGKDDLVLPNRGVVKLIYGDAIISKQINNEGEATFKQVPERFFQPDARVEILFHDPEGEPYRAVHHDSLYQLNRGEYIALPVKLQGLGQIRGIVKDSRSGDPVEGVRVSVHQDVYTFSNQYGEYSLQIPPEKQAKFQTIRAYKEGYESFEQANVPVQTGREIPIFLKPKN